MYVHDHLSLEQLQAWAKRHSQKRRIWGRSQAVVLAWQGRTTSDIAQALGVSRRAVQEWVAKYNRGGPEALLERPHPGRPRRLAPDRYQERKQRLNAPTRPDPTMRSVSCVASISNASWTRSSRSSCRCVRFTTCGVISTTAT